MKNVQAYATEIIKPIAEELGYYLVEVSYKKEVSGMVLAVCIDKDGGVDINDCERLSKALDLPLDEADVTNGASYNLNVSSYGLDRAFKTDYDFNKHIGQEVIIKFYKPWNGKKQVQAILAGFTESSIDIDYENSKHTIERKDIALIQKYIEF
ncbi:MAG: ribosome maturation factor RimP [Clostridia bacterium]|nr:ribosome maturation factor RimP [Clostridia bacterium]